MNTRRFPILPLVSTAVSAVLAVSLATGAVAQTPARPGNAPAPTGLSTGAAAEYRLGSGDAIKISVFQNPDMTLETRVSEAGTISFPLLGVVRIGGLSVSDAESRIAEGLRKGNFVKQPQVTILVLKVTGNQASVLGQVNQPGRYPLEVADTRLTDLLANARGVSPAGGDLLVLTGQRGGKPFRLEVDLPTLFGPNGREQDVVVLNGDVLWVERFPMIYIYGEVQKPGQIRLERGMTLLQGLAAGGGLTLRGTDRGIRVHRKDASGKVQEIKPGMDEPLKDGDVIFVRESLF
ncbi:polysaccharide export protein EpsE [Mitsuaria sp. TWR114]|uniref:polysaccharide export protein EpsE n=1 Tax=unclassified Roseateles TaxID=2626991 RepID=UPI0011BEAAE8|nr:MULTISPECIES: polysaccharide export protein EpsE [unclassified Roseateles]MBB3284775.1 polysaccharide export outer membrane protein [Mitsuaria sp. BK037]MBB3291929.1 polysaccharide export outer membrane protein [Mitsuaria sp. BK041]MBB3361146.1 polysaccharide export outer membrane protein [Mitsuaria sp. BK045]TXD82259.1 polysaccharide export protein EpsE [Mitsuaria sp. TWR114]